MEKDMEKGDVDIARPDQSHVAEHATNRVSFPRSTSPLPPPPPPKEDLPPRPMTSSTRRLSFSTVGSQRIIKYGQGKLSQTELNPQPSDDPDDPLNWPQWKKELNFIAILMTVGLIGGMKTAYISVNSVLSVQLNVSYTAVASLTAVPLIISAFTGLASLVASKVWGKRPVYLVSMVLVLIGASANSGTGRSFGGCMAARVFQGLGWGAFDTLVLGSIHDTFFEHERKARITIYNILSVAATWGAPILGGLASQNANSFTIQFDIISVLQILAVPLLVLGAPETAFDRWFSSSPAPTPGSTAPWASQPPKPLRRPSVEELKAYLREMRPVSFSGRMDSSTLLQAPRAFVSPTTGLLFVVTFMPYCTLWGLTESVSMLYFPMPFMLSESSLGLMMTAPMILGVLTLAGLDIYGRRHADYSRYQTVFALLCGSALAAAGILAFGLTTHDVMVGMPAAYDSSNNATTTTTTTTSDPRAYAMNGLATRLSFPLLSLLLGLLAAGVGVLDSAIRPLVWRSTKFTSSNMNVCLRTVADMDAGVTCWRNLFAGVFVMTMPSAVVMYSGLQATVIGLGVSQILIAAGACGVWWFFDERLKTLDGRVMRLVDLLMLQRTASFFDTD